MQPPQGHQQPPGRTPVLKPFSNSSRVRYEPRLKITFYQHNSGLEMIFLMKRWIDQKKKIHFKKTLRICFSSRYAPYITAVFYSFTWLSFENVGCNILNTFQVHLDYLKTNFLDHLNVLKIFSNNQLSIFLPLSTFCKDSKPIVVHVKIW